MPPEPLVQLVEPPLSGGLPAARVRAALSPEGSAPVIGVVHIRGSRRSAGAHHREALSLVFQVSEVFVSQAAGSQQVLQIALGRGLRKRGNACLTMRIGVERCGAQDPHTLYVMCVSAGLQWRGKELVSLAVMFGRWAGCRRVVLSDGAIVGCPSGELYDLSMFILMRYGVTWYMQQGFRPVVSPAISCGGSTPSFEKGNAQRVRRASAGLLAMTCGDILADVFAIGAVLGQAIREKATADVQFDERCVWKRNKKIDESDRRFLEHHNDAVLTLAHIMSRINKGLSHVKKSTPFVGWLAALQKTDCAAFILMYRDVFDNDLYYWRNRRCMYHVQYGGYRFVFRAASFMQTISAALDPDENGEMWFEYAL